MSTANLSPNLTVVSETRALCQGLLVCVKTYKADRACQGVKICSEKSLFSNQGPAMQELETRGGHQLEGNQRHPPHSRLSLVQQASGPPSSGPYTDTEIPEPSSSFASYLSTSSSCHTCLSSISAKSLDSPHNCDL